jgi:GDPmannose 4,6-dehydratase
MLLLLQQDDPDDYIVGTGESHTVREFVEEAFSYVGLDWTQYVEMDARYLRPLDVGHLVADASRARQRLGWEPKVMFKELIRIMVDADMEAVGLAAIGEGKKILAAKLPQWHDWTSSVTAVLANKKAGFE